MGAVVITMLLAAQALSSPVAAPEQVKLSVTVSLERAGEAPAGTGVVAVDGRSKEGAALHEEVKTAIPGTVSFSLHSGVVWTIAVRSPEYWAAAKSVFVAADDQVVIPAVPAGTVHVRLDEAVKEPPEVTFWAWTAAVGPGAPSTPLLAEEPCTRQSTSVECRGPAGRLDLRLGARGFLPTYYWDKAVPPHGTLDLGVLKLAEGSSVSGWCEGLGANQPATVVLTPVQLGGVANLRSSEQTARRALSAPVSERGFFQVSGVPVGEYDVFVEAKGLVSPRLSVRVGPGVEARLPEPIRLTPPASLAVSVVPPVDTRGLPWGLELASLGYIPGRERTELRGSTSPEGEWAATGLSPGPYYLNVADGAGNTWDGRRIEVEGAATVSVEVSPVEVEGRLTRKGEPLAADIWFEMGPMTAATAANAEGRFACTLPKEGRWDVRLESGSTHVTVGDVDVRVPPGKSRASVEIDLAATRLRGIVVDLAGKPQANFTVFAMRNGGVQHSEARSGSDGAFEIEDLPVGEYSVEARWRNLQTRRVTVSLKEDPEAAIRLVVEEGNRIRGTVTSQWGPVAGAGVSGFPVGAFQPGVPTARLAATTDSAGSFEVTLPPGAQAADLLILPPGLAGRLVRLPASDEPVAIVARADGGLLRIVSGSRGAQQLSNGEASMPLAAVTRLAGSWPASGGAQASASLVMEPGRYGICPFPQGQCTWGVLSPRGELTLESPQSRPRASP